MAVKHKVVEVRDSQIIGKILRDLQRFENGLQGPDLTRLCEQIVSFLGTVTMPQSTEDYIKFMLNVKEVQENLMKACSSEELISTTLKALYNGISDSQKSPAPTMSIVLQLIDVKLMPNAVNHILHSGYSDQNLEQALKTLCKWLSKWTWTPNLGPLVLNFMQGLENERHYDILIDVTLEYIESLFKLIILKEPREFTGPVVLYMLASMQHSPEAFHKVIPHVPTVLALLDKENSESSHRYIKDIVNLFMDLIDHFPTYPGHYDELKQTLEMYNPTKNYQHSLNYKSWLNNSSSIVTVSYSPGRVGLNNLGNTCYMNSVLQALFMTKLFRNDMLQSSRDCVPLISKLQKLFVLLQYSQRTVLSPCEIFNLARPPGFQQGHQHDSSEFMGYLLDILHEQERSVFPSSQNTEPAAEVVPAVTLVQKSFGGRTVTVSRCGNCGTQSERADHFRELQLSFPTNSSNQSVQKLLDYYFQPEKLCDDNQYHCEKCHRLTDSERVTRVVELPCRLVLTLKQFRYDPALQVRTKLLQQVVLDEYINLENEEYILYAAVVHCGSSLDSGHYYTFARDGEDWYKFNDCTVVKTNPSDLFTLKPPETPYILFYRKHNFSDPESLQKTALSQKLQRVLSKDNAEIDSEKKRKLIKINRYQQDKNDGPPPPGCGGGGFNDSISKLVC